MIISHNLSAMNASRMANINNDNSSKAMGKLSSGTRITTAGDDAAGLAISTKMRAQIGGLNQAAKNAQDGISLIQTADGALSQTASMLQRMRDLAVNAATGTATATDRTAMATEFIALQGEIDKVATLTTFNSKVLLDGTLADDAAGTYAAGSGTGTINVQTGALANETLAVIIENMDSTALTVDAATTTIDTVANAALALAKVDVGIATVSDQRSVLGATQNRLQYKIDNLNSVSQNTSSASAKITDTDMASEMVEYSKSDILNQAAQSMLAKANQSSQNVLQLLR